MLTPAERGIRGRDCGSHRSAARGMMKNEEQADTTRRVLSASRPLMARRSRMKSSARRGVRLAAGGCAAPARRRGDRGPARRPPGCACSWRREKCFPLRLPVHTLGNDRPSHLGLELVHHDALSDLVDLRGREVLNPGHPLCELGDAALQVRLGWALAGMLSVTCSPFPSTRSFYTVLHNL